MSEGVTANLHLRRWRYTPKPTIAVAHPGWKMSGKCFEIVKSEIPSTARVTKTTPSDDFPLGKCFMESVVSRRGASWSRLEHVEVLLAEWKHRSTRLTAGRGTKDTAMRRKDSQRLNTARRSCNTMRDLQKIAKAAKITTLP